ncbi:MAG TPA: hypothetical protein VJ842_05200 [Pyrinomonadaceae bacterium]|nr:hypothetical protein [Pyrinomonadaceae bacterium]
MSTIIEVHAEQRESAAQLSQRVSKLEADRERIEQQATITRSVLADVRARLLTGDATLADVTLAQAKTSALEGALIEADDELSRLRVSLAEAKQREDEEATAARLETLHAERARLQEQFNAATQEFDEACERAAATFSSLNRQYNEAGREIQAIIERGGNQRLADIYVRDRGCAWPRLRFGEQITNVLTKYGNDEARREEKQRAALRGRA